MKLSEKLSPAMRQLSAIVIVVVGIISLVLINKFFKVKSVDIAIIIAGFLLYNAIQSVKEIKLAQIENAADPTGEP